MKNGMSLVHGAAVALAAGLMTVGAFGAFSEAGSAQAGARESEPPPYAPEVADEDGRYDPKIDPANFVRRVDNRYFPLKPGTKYIYEGKTKDGTERVEVEVTRQTKTILGVQCIIVRDRAYLNGELIEDTFDWHAQDKKGNVWYFGEDTKEYKNGKVVSTAGSFEAGVDGAKAGIIMEANPRVGDSYRQEFYKGEAEDSAEVVSRDAAGLNDTVDVPHGSFENVLVTKDWAPLEPNVLEHKYYAPGVGLIGAEKVVGGSDRIELVDVKTG